MTIPVFHKIMLPLLKTISSGESFKIADLNEEIRDNFFNLTDNEKIIKLNNGRTKFHDRLLWARTYLKKAGLVEDPERKYVRITSEGLNVLKLNLEILDLNFLMKYNSFRLFREKGKDENSVNVNNNLEISEDFSPQDMMEIGYDKIQSTLNQELLEKLKSMDPYYFEKIMLDLFHKMGYGDPIETKKSNDGGIDGIINQDELGLEKIYIQCKRYSKSNIREPEIRNFIGAMSSEVNKGIFVTTSDFDKKAIEKARFSPHKMILINGNKLTSLMIKFNIGIQERTKYILKDIDSEYFEE